MIKKFRIVLSFLALLILVSALVGCAPAPAPKKVKKVASNIQLPLIVYKEGNEIKGYEYEIYKEALKRAGYEVEVSDTAFSGLFAGLQAEKWDFVCSNVFITVAREAEMDFTEPFFSGYDAAVALKDGKVSKLEDFKGKVIGTETGTSQAAWLASMINTYGPFETRLYENAETTYLDLENGRIQAVTTSYVRSKILIKSGKPYKIVGTSKDNFMVGCAIRTGDPVKAEFDKALQSMKKDGTMAGLFKKYFEEDAPAGSPAITVFTQPHIPTK